MKLKQLVLLMSVVFLLAATATLYFYSHNVIVEEWAIPAEAIVDGRMAFQHDTGKLLFGNIKQGNAGKKFINVSHQQNERMRVLVGMEGDLGSWTYVWPNDFLLDAGEYEKITFTLDIPENASDGNYSGTVRVVFKRPII